MLTGYISAGHILQKDKSCENLLLEEEYFTTTASMLTLV